MSNQLVKMKKDDLTGEYHPDNVQDMLDHGWEIVDGNPSSTSRRSPSAKKVDAPDEDAKPDK